MARSKKSRNVAPYSMKGFPKHATASPLTNDNEPDWSKMDITATSKNLPKLPDEVISRTELTDKQKKMKEKYPDLFKARHEGGKNTLKARLQSVEQGMDMGGDMIPVGAAMGLGSKLLQGDFGVDDIKKYGVKYLTKKANKIKKGAEKLLSGGQWLYDKLNK
tara:strand:- start:107 stop:592 length:486 start_codon:yes stop_codon:yes gene_type:complete